MSTLNIANVFDGEFPWSFIHSTKYKYHRNWVPKLNTLS